MTFDQRIGSDENKKHKHDEMKFFKQVCLL